MNITEKDLHDFTEAFAQLTPETIHVSAEVFDKLQDMIDNPAKPTEALINLMNKHKGISK